MKTHQTVQVTALLEKSKVSSAAGVAGCRAPRFEFASESLHHRTTSQIKKMKCFHRSKKVTGLNPKPQQAFLSTVSILSGCTGFPPIKGIQAGLAHTGGTGSCSASGLTSIWPASVVVRLLYFFVCCLSLLREHVRLCASVFTASPSSDMQHQSR